MSGASTTKKTSKRPEKNDWAKFDAMTPTQRHAAAMADHDARPIRPEDLARMPRVPQVRIIRRALKLSQEEFSARYMIPLGTLRDWEQDRKQPDAAAKAYLRVIAKEPNVVWKALSGAKPQGKLATG